MLLVLVSPVRLKLGISSSSSERTVESVGRPSSPSSVRVEPRRPDSQFTLLKAPNTLELVRMRLLRPQPAPRSPRSPGCCQGSLAAGAEDVFLT